MSLRTALRESADTAGVKPIAPPPTPPIPDDAAGAAWPEPFSEVASVGVVTVGTAPIDPLSPTRVSVRKRSLSGVLASGDFTDPKNARASSPSKRAPCLDPTEYCSFCCLLEEAPRLLTCHLCGNSGHKNCLQFEDRLWDHCKANETWTCIECKSCAVCESAENDDLMLFCDHCDEGVHMYCLATPLFSLPKGEWLCPKCADGTMPRRRPTKPEITKFKAQRLKHLGLTTKAQASKSKGGADAPEKRGPGRIKGSKNKVKKLSVILEGPILVSVRKGLKSKSDKNKSKADKGKVDKGKRKAEPKEDFGRGNAILSPQRFGMKATSFKRRKGEPAVEDEELYDEARQRALDAASRCREDDDSGAGAADPTVDGKPWVVFGGSEVQAWYSAPYPEEYAVLPKLYVCEFCLKYMKSAEARNRHRHKCELKGQPPGTEIYRSGQFQIWEIDGAASKIYCQNLCLLSKLFLDHKTLYYDVETFLFYVMTTWDAYGSHFVGYFSKEKDSMLEYNLSCIMTMPHVQRQGFGQFLIDFSFLLSRREKKLGSPEKPLSALGKVAYTKYWKASIVDCITRSGEAVSVGDLAVGTGMHHSDVISTLNDLGFLKKADDGSVVIVVDPTVIKSHTERAKRTKANRSEDLIMDKALLRWTPPSERPMML